MTSTTSTRLSRFALVVALWLLCTQSVVLAQTITRGPYIQLANLNSVNIVWYTDIPVESCVRTGQDCAALTEVCDRKSVTRHEMTISKLAPGTSYCYEIRATGRALARRDGRDRFTFQTNKADGLFRFLAFGDFGTGNAVQLQLVKRMLESQPKPDFIVAPGDLIYPKGEEENYTPYFFEPYKELIERIPVYPSIGNHDNYTDHGAPYLRIFSLPANGPQGIPAERNYTFEYANAFFVSLDSDIPTKQDEQQLREAIAPWASKALGQASKRWKIVFFHHAPFSSGPNQGYPDIPVIRDILPRVMSAKGVDLVLNGHEHIYERTRPIDGVVYVVTGAAGHGLYPKKFERDYTEVFEGAPDGRHSYTQVDILDEYLVLKQIDKIGCEIDTMILYKPAAWGDLWKYWKGVSFPGEKWMDPGFDDSNWLSGAAPFGYGFDNLGTALSDMQNRYVTVYARRSFLVFGATEIRDATLKLDYDDGCRCFLNGIEVAKRNVADGGDHKTPANTSRDPGTFDMVRIERGLLREGENVLACEVKNWALESSDVFFQSELLLSYSEPRHCPPGAGPSPQRPAARKPAGAVKPGAGSRPLKSR